MIREIFDRGVALIGLFLLLPFFLIIALSIKLDSKGPVFYKGKRIGKRGKEFLIYKFRSMVFRSEIERDITIKGDPRITRVGRFLRKTKIDELPQLFNVLKGEMSLVGPRPESPRYVRFYSDREKGVLMIKPGITGLTQLAYKDEELWLSSKNPEDFYLREVLPKKLEIDLNYIKNRSFWKDLKILIKTLFHIA